MEFPREKVTFVLCRATLVRQAATSIRLGALQKESAYGASGHLASRVSG